jgi:hypothetical protein
MLGEDAAAERIDLAEGDGSHPGALEAEAETADPAEEIEDIHAALRSRHLPSETKRGGWYDNVG